MAVTQYARELKKHLKKKWGFVVRVSTSGTKKPDPYMEVSPKNWREDYIPNPFRLRAVKLIGGSPSNPKNVSYGNIQPNRMTLSYGQWVELVGPLESTAGPKRAPRKKKPAPTGEALYKALKKIVDESQNAVIPGIGRVDMTTASMIVKLADKINATNRKKFLALEWSRLHSTTMRMMR